MTTGMSEEVFSECLKYFNMNGGNAAFWDELVVKFKYSSKEALRSQFRRERRARGIYRLETANSGDVGNLPVVGIFDVETLPLVGLMFEMYDQNFNFDALLSEGGLLSWSGKYLFSSAMYSDILTPDEITHDKHYNFQFDTYRISSSLWAFMNSCDIIIGHNSKDFDRKVANTAFQDHRLGGVRYRDIDTYKIIVENFKLPSKSLAYVNKRWGIRSKGHTGGMKLWKKCLAGDVQALEQMLNYNEGDVLATESLFWEVHSYARNLPNFSTYSHDETTVCNTCRSENFYRNGWWYTDLAKFERYRCDDCGSNLRGRKNTLPKSKVKSLLSRV